MPEAMWCYQTSSMLLPVTGISARMFEGRETRGMWRKSQVAPGLKWIMRCIHLCEMMKTVLRHWSKSLQNWRDCSSRCMMLATMCQIWNLCCVTFRKKERWFNYATIVKNWLLHLGSPAHPRVHHSTLPRICVYAASATIQQR
jgi:hypothetical protein